MKVGGLTPPCSHAKNYDGGWYCIYDIEERGFDSTEYPIIPKETCCVGCSKYELFDELDKILFQPS